MSQTEFIDLCILCGCDYTTNIPGIGPVTAFKLMEDYKNIEAIIEKIEKDNEDPKKKKRTIPDNFRFTESRELFINPSVENEKAALEALIKWGKPDEEALKEFLVLHKGFTETKVENGLKKLKACQGKANQGRLDSFFKALPAKTNSAAVTKLVKGQPSLNFKKSMPSGKK